MLHQGPVARWVSWPVPVAGGRWEDPGADGGCAGQREQGGRPPRPRRASKLEVAGGVFDGFGGDVGGGTAGAGGEVAQHHVEAELAAGLRELNVEAAPGRPPGKLRAGLVE